MERGGRKGRDGKTTHQATQIKPMLGSGVVVVVWGVFCFGLGGVGGEKSEEESVKGRGVLLKDSQQRFAQVGLKGGRREKQLLFFTPRPPSQSSPTGPRSYFVWFGLF